LLVGQLNPLFGQAVDPAIRSEMLRFLQALADENENVTLLENMPLQNTEDYEDLTHVTKRTQEKFTVFFTEWLRAFITKQHSF
jgi:ABC-type thiamine transport system ATPase subunit